MDDCCCVGKETLILACSGSSNVGQIANRAMIEFSKQGRGSAFCLAGVEADLSGFVESAKEAETILIDGCRVACGKKMMGRHGITPTRYLVVTDFGVEKAHHFDDLDNETRIALEGMLAILYSE